MNAEQKAKLAKHLEDALWLVEQDQHFLKGILEAKRRYEFWKGKKGRPVATEGKKWMTPARVNRCLVDLAAGLNKTNKLLRLSCDSMEE